MKFDQKRITRALVVASLLLIVFLLKDVKTASANEPSSEGLIAYYDFEDTLSDLSPNANDGTAVGDLEFVDAMKGKGASFDGESYIEVEDSDSLDITKSFSYSVWVKAQPVNLNKPFPIIFKNRDDDQQYPYKFTLGYHNSFWPYNYFNIDGAYYECRYDTPIDWDKWTNVTVTWDGTNMKFYTDGKYKGSKNYSEGMNVSTGKLYIGFDGESYFTGTMDELRFYNRALSQSEVKDLYTSVYQGSYIDQLQNKLVACYNFDGDLKDSSGFGNDGDVVGDGISFTGGIAGSGDGKDGVKFDGEGYIEVKDSDSLDIDKAFTFSAWLLPDKSFSKAAIIYKKRLDKYSYWWYVFKEYGNSLSQRLEVTDIVNDPYDLGLSATSPLEKWTLLSVVYDGSNMKYYINGKLQNDESFDKIISHSNQELMIGGGADNYYKGLMDELKIYNYALTDKEIKTLYSQKNEFTSNIPSTMALNSSLTLKATMKPLRADKMDITEDCTILIKGSSGKLIQFEKGKLKAKGKGKAVLELKYKGYSQTYNITIK